MASVHGSCGSSYGARTNDAAEISLFNAMFKPFFFSDFDLPVLGSFKDNEEKISMKPEPTQPVVTLLSAVPSAT